MRFSGGDTLLSRNDRVLGTTQHSQKENSQAEKISLRAFLSRREAKGTDEATSRVTLLAELRLGEGSTFNSATTKQLQELNKIYYHVKISTSKL